MAVCRNVTHQDPRLSLAQYSLKSELKHHSVHGKFSTAKVSNSSTSWTGCVILKQWEGPITRIHLINPEGGWVLDNGESAGDAGAI